MPKVELSPTLSLGNVLTIITLILSLAGTWVVLSSDVAKNSARLDALQMQVQEAKDAAKEQANSQIEAVELMTQMRTDIRYLRQAVERLTANQSRLYAPESFQ